jgi:hypothetical protein
MEIYPESQLPSRWDIICSVDLADAGTPQVLISGVWYDAVWSTVSTPVTGGWQRTMKLTLGGVDANPDEVDALALLDEEPRVKIPIGTTVLTGRSSERLVTKG